MRFLCFFTFFRLVSFLFHVEASRELESPFARNAKPPTRGDKGATYGAPNLSGESGNFELVSVEAWAVGPRPDEEPGAKNRKKKGGGGGVLDARHNDAKMLMESARRDAGGPEREER